jgi:hypothetical protein
VKTQATARGKGMPRPYYKTFKFKKHERCRYFIAVVGVCTNDACRL